MPDLSQRTPAERDSARKKSAQVLASMHAGDNLGQRAQLVELARMLGRADHLDADVRNLERLLQARRTIKTLDRDAITKKQSKLRRQQE